MSTTVRVEVNPASDISAGHSAYATVTIDGLTLVFHGLTWPADSSITETIGTIDRLMSALRTVREQQASQARGIVADGGSASWVGMSESELRALHGDR